MFCHYGLITLFASCCCSFGSCKQVHSRYNRASVEYLLEFRFDFLIIHFLSTRLKYIYSMPTFLTNRFSLLCESLNSTIFKKVTVKFMVFFALRIKEIDQMIRLVLIAEGILCRFICTRGGKEIYNNLSIIE